MPNTTVGKEVENFVEHSLEQSGYNVESQVIAGGINQCWNYIDLVLCFDDIQDEAISLKYQSVKGTAEEKIPFEAESLAKMVRTNGYAIGTIVLCGFGWDEFKYNWFLNEYRPPAGVRIMSYDDFVARYIEHDVMSLYL